MWLAVHPEADLGPKSGQSHGAPLSPIASYRVYRTGCRSTRYPRCVSAGAPFGGSTGGWLVTVGVPRGGGNFSFLW
ncbi:hypothetical protein GCM10010483_69900 [Actinokineospora diospyrosa]